VYFAVKVKGGVGDEGKGGKGEFPERVMFTFHPQRWTDRPVLWLRELLLQNMKNVVKGMIVNMKNDK